MHELDNHVKLRGLQDSLIPTHMLAQLGTKGQFGSLALECPRDRMNTSTRICHLVLKNTVYTVSEHFKSPSRDLYMLNLFRVQQLNHFWTHRNYFRLLFLSHPHIVSASTLHDNNPLNSIYSGSRGTQGTILLLL